MPESFLNVYLVFPSICLLLILVLGYVGVLPAFSSELEDKFEGTLWHKIGKYTWTPPAGSQLIGLAIMAFYLIVTAPILIACCISGYFSKRSKDNGVIIMSRIVGVIGIAYFIGIGVWIAKSI